MADQKISQLNSLTKATSATNDVLPIVDTSASETKKITYQELLQPQDNVFRIAGSADNTKLVAFEVDGLTTGTTRTITIPDASTTLVGTDATQTLTNKTLTSPQINFGSDATGDTYFRNGSGVTARLAIGSEGQVYTVRSGVPVWEANAAASDASTTVKGVSELATLAETLARTTTGGTGAKLVVTPDNLTTVQTYDYAASSGGTDAYAITVTPAPTAYTTGQVFTFKADVANTGAATLNVNSLGAKTIKKNVSSDLATGDILANQIVTVIYDGTNFQMQSRISQPVVYANGVTTHNAANTGAETIAHGLGVIPKKVMIHATKATSSATLGSVSRGVYNGTTTSTIYFTTGETGTPDNWINGTSSSDIVYLDLKSSQTNTATISVDATNITLTWSKTSTPTGTVQIMWEAEA